MACDHKTEEEFKACGQHMAFSRVAKVARRLLAARKRFMDSLLTGTIEEKDAAQMEMQPLLASLEREVKQAEDSGYYAD